MILDCQGRLSCVPLVSFMNFFVFIMKNTINVFFILVFIGDQAISRVVKMMPVRASASSGSCYVQDTLHIKIKKNTVCFIQKVESSHREISGQVTIL